MESEHSNEVRRLEQRVEALRNELASLNKSRSRIKHWKTLAVRKQLFDTVRQRPLKKEPPPRINPIPNAIACRRRRLKSTNDPNQTEKRKTKNFDISERSSMRLKPIRLPLALPEPLNLGMEEIQREALFAFKSSCTKCSPLKAVKVDHSELGSNLREATEIEAKLRRMVAESCLLLKLLPILRKIEVSRLREALTVLRLFPGYNTLRPTVATSGNNLKSCRMLIRPYGHDNYWVKAFGLVLEQLLASATKFLSTRLLRRESVIKVQCFIRQRRACAVLGRLVKEEMLQLQLKFWDLLEPLLRYTPLDSSTTLQCLRSAGLKKSEGRKLLRFINICAKRNGEFSIYRGKEYLKDISVMQRFVTEDAQAMSIAALRRKNMKVQQAQARRQAQADQLNDAKSSDLLQQSLKIQVVKQEKLRRDQEWNVYQHLQLMTYKL